MFTGIASSIFGLLMGGLPAIAREIGKAKVDLANAQTEHEKAEIEERVRTLQVRADALARQQQNPWTIVAQFLFIAPVAFYWFVTMAWDKIMCKWNVFTYFQPSCTTDPLADWQIVYVTMIMTFFFVGGMITKIKA